MQSHNGRWRSSHESSWDGAAGAHAAFFRRRPGAEAFEVLVCDPVTGKTQRTLEVHTFAVRVAFAPDGKTLATGLADGTIVLWDSVTGLKLQEVKGHVRQVTSLAFSPDGRTLVSGAFDGTMKVWQIE